jgi:hypothetical protein
MASHNQPCGWAKGGNALEAKVGEPDSLSSLTMKITWWRSASRRRLLAWHLPDRVARAHRAAHHDPAVGSSQAKLAPGWRVDESQSIDAKTC